MATYTFDKTGAEITIVANGVTFVDPTPSGYNLAVDPFNNKVIITHHTGKIRSEVDVDDDDVEINGEVFSGTAQELKDELISEIFSVTGGSSEPVEVAILALTTDLSDAQIKALPSAYTELVPAPGAGKMLLFHRAAFRWNTTGGSYTNIDANHALAIVSGEWEIEVGTLITMNSSADERIGFMSINTGEYPVAAWSGYLREMIYNEEISKFENKPLKLVVDNGAAGNFTGGHASNTLKITVYYSEVDIA